jgi:hypothetical protein
VEATAVAPARLLGENGKERESQGKRELREKRRRASWRWGRTPGRLLDLQRQAGGGTPVTLRWTRRSAYWKKKKGVFVENPLRFGGFQEKK